MGHSSNVSVTKNFLHIRDFYNWIKDKSGDNSPATFYWFSVNFYKHKGGAIFNDPYFSSKQQEIIDFKFSIQSINLPHINYTGYNAQGTTGNPTSDASNMFGTYTVLGNSYIGIESKKFSMKILNTYSPIVERFLYPWMIKCLQNTNDNKKQKRDDSTFPRMDMAIKFWKPNVIQDDMESVKPEFVYFVTGIFPSKIEAYNPKQSAQSQDNNRDVTFDFNEFVMIGDNETATKFDKFGLYSGYEGGNRSWNDMIKNWISNAAIATISNRAKDLLKNKNKTSNTNKQIPTTKINSYNSVNSNIQTPLNSQTKVNSVSSMNVPVSSFNPSDIINSINSLKANERELTINDNINSYNSVNSNIQTPLNSQTKVNSVSSMKAPVNSFNSSEITNSINSLKANERELTINDNINSIRIDDRKRNIDQILSKMRNEDENFEDIVEVDNELENSQRGNKENSEKEKNVKSIGSSQNNFESTESVKLSRSIGESNNDFSGSDTINSSKSLQLNGKQNLESSDQVKSSESIGSSQNNFESTESVKLSRSIGNISSELESKENLKSFNSLGGTERQLNSLDQVKSSRSIGSSQNNFESTESVRLSRSIGESNPNFSGSDTINSSKSLQLNGKQNLESSDQVKSSDINDDKIKRDLNQILSKMKNEDENFEDIVEVDDELENSQKSSAQPIDNRSGVIRDANAVRANLETSKVAKSILIDNREIISTGNISNIKPGDYVGLQIEKGTKEDAVITSLSNNKNITSLSYSYLSNYAKRTNEKVADVIKKYKALSGKELNNFVLKLANHSTTNVIKPQKTIEKAEKNSEIIVSNNKSNNKISDLDLDGLF